MTGSRSEIAVIGGGHNGLVAATYLARAGYRVGIFEARSELGGAVASKELFDGVAARLSRFSYLVSLLPNSIIEELGLRLELRSRQVRSYTPVDSDGSSLSVRKNVTRDSFRALTGDDREYRHE
jgi:phytoene dehydrogenase-like protein